MQFLFGASRSILAMLSLQDKEGNRYLWLTIDFGHGGCLGKPVGSLYLSQLQGLREAYRGSLESI